MPQPWAGAAWRPTNTKAILSVALLSFPIAAIVLGILARTEIKRSGEAGWGLATTGMVVGIVIVAGYALFLLLYVGFFLAVMGGAFFRVGAFGP